MKKNNAVIVLGILFGLGLIAIGVLYFIVSIALAFGGNGWFMYIAFAMVPLALCTIVGSCFARKKIMVSRITLSIAVVGYLVSIIILVLIPNVTIGGYLIPMGMLFTLGLIALVLSFVVKPVMKVDR